MNINITNYGDYDEIEIAGMHFYSRGDERNFFYHLGCLNIQSWSKEDIIQFNLDYNLQKWQILELISLFKRYELYADVIADLEIFKKINR